MFIGFDRDNGSIEFRRVGDNVKVSIKIDDKRVGEHSFIRGNETEGYLTAQEMRAVVDFWEKTEVER